MRRRSSNWLLRTTLWLAYLSADSVAVFVLGHLAVRAREPGHQLVAFWAPFVLVHLGGQDSITAFSKQDNELWGRHLLNLVIQAGVAGYVVAKASWPDTRLRAAMVIMFICGCFKYAVRVLCLFATDPKILWWNTAILLSRKIMRDRGKIKKTEGTRYEAKQDMRARLDRMEKGRSAEPPWALLDDAIAIIGEVISVDAPLNKVQNISVAAQGDLPGLLKGFLSNKSRYRAYQHLAELLQYCYQLLYTKDVLPIVLNLNKKPFDHVSNPILKTCYNIFSFACLLFMQFSTAIAASISLALMAATEKGDQLGASSRVDIKVTYALLVGAILLDVPSAAIFFFPHLSFYHPCLAKPTQSSVVASCMKQWSQQIGHYNIINNAAMRPVLQWFHFDVERKPITKDDTSIEKFILDTLLGSGTRQEWSIASTRGQLALHNWILDHHPHEGHYSADHLKSLQETLLEADFPTSVLILHIATDICYHCRDSDHQAVKKHKQTSTQLSHYIMYLVFKCGMMLTTNSEVVRYRTCLEINGVLLSHPPNVNDQRNKNAARVMKLVEAIQEQQEEGPMGEIQTRHKESEKDSTVEIENEESTDIGDNVADDHIKKLERSSETLTSPVLPRAVAVAQELISIENEAERWELIAKVWAEMLYYTAPRCGGDFHYEHLSTGGEFVSHVLLLMYYLGPFLPPPPDA